VAPPSRLQTIYWRQQKQVSSFFVFPIYVSDHTYLQVLLPPFSPILSGWSKLVYSLPIRILQMPTRVFLVSIAYPFSYSLILNPRHADGIYKVSKTEGIRGLWKGTSLALFGVTNGSLQFMAYELMKDWGFDRKAKRMEAMGEQWSLEKDKLVRILIIGICTSDTSFQSNAYYTLISGTSKLFALAATYPYQVVRARIQVRSAKLLLFLSSRHY
jgi:Mitochondrial carrier protein